MLLSGSKLIHARHKTYSVTYFISNYCRHNHVDLFNTATHAKSFNVSIKIAFNQISLVYGQRFKLLFCAFCEKYSLNSAHTSL
jgi:hypothetical protein